MRRIGFTLLVLATCLAVAAPARAADPGRWRVTGTTTLPLLYYQGVTVDPARNFYFDGIYVGLYRTDPAFTETGRTADVIPPDVHASEGYNHIGDISWDRAEGGRVLLPLECYVPNGPNGGNPCLHGSVGVADPGTLQWRYHVKLDPAEIPKAMWNEVSPDGTLVWTSSGGDLLAYRAADISLANAAPEHAPIHSVRRLKGAVPPTGITGATFVDGSLLVAGQDRRTFRVYSLDLATGARELEIEQTIVGESEGLVTAAVRRGTIGWLIQPFNPEGNPPTYSPDHATLVSFARRAGAGTPGTPGTAATPAAGSGAGLSPALRFFHRTRRNVLRRGFLAGVLCPEGCRATLTVKRGRQLLARTSRRVRPGPIAKVRVKLTKRGRRVLREDHRRLRLTLRAALRLPSGATAKRRATARLR
jgi:hypothetical protein